MASVQFSAKPWPVGPPLRPRSSEDRSYGHRSIFNGGVWRRPLASSLYADISYCQVLAGVKEFTAITLAVPDGVPLKILVSFREKTEGKGEFVGRAYPRIKADSRFQNRSVPTISALVVAATIEVHRERNWRVRVLWGLDLHYQPRKPHQSGTTKDEGQVFDKMLTPDLFQNRVPVSFSDQKKYTGRASECRHNSQGSGADLHAHASREQKTEDPAPFQIMIRLLSGKTWLQWVKPSDLVQSIKLKLEAREGVPAASQRLLFEGKQLEDYCPLACYNIQRNASIRMSLRLRGGAGGQSSPAATFSYKDAVHSQKPKDKAPPTQAPKPFLVDKLEETPSIELTHPVLDRQHQIFAEHAIICRFNGLWPRTADLYQWVHANWTSHCRVFLCSKGFFITVFADTEDYQRALTEGPWFWNSAGLFLTPWFPEFDPATAVITKLPIWVRLPNLPAHLWNFVVFEAIGNSLGRYLSTDADRGLKGMYTFARICAEIDLSKGLPEQINLKIGDFHWTQPLDFENTAFRCRNCHLTGHLQSSCPSMPFPQKKANAKPKSKSWKPHDPPPFDVFSSSDEENEEEDEEVMDESPEQVAPSARHEEATVPPISQKRTHESSPSGSDKELSPSAQRSLQIVQAQQGSIGWVKVGKKKGKKGRPNDSTLAV